MAEVRAVTAPPSLARAAWLLGLAAAYVATARLGLALDPVAGFATLVWPPTGIALAVLGRRGLWLWPAVSAAALIANLWSGAPWPAAAAIAVGNTLEALLGAQLLRRVSGGDGAIRRVRDALGLLAAAALGPVVSASLGAVSLSFAEIVAPDGVWEFWRAWWLGDALGTLVVAPVLLNWNPGAIAPRTPARAAEAASLALATLASAALCFSGDPEDPLQRPHLIFPAIIWAAIRFGPGCASLAVLVVSGIAIGLVASGVGPFVAPTLSENLTALQGFMGTVALTSLFLAALSAERATAQRILSEQYARLHAIAEATSDSIFVKDLQGRYVFVNPAHGRVLGSDPDSAVGKRDADFFTAEVAQQLSENDRAAARSERGSVCEENVIVNGEPRTFLTARAPYRVAGKVAGNIGIACDITDRKNVERELQEAVQVRDEFLSVASHELKTPLAALTLQVTGLRRALQPQPGAREGQQGLERVDRAVGQVARLTRLVDDLLDVSRITAGRLQLNRESFDLSRLVQEVANAWMDRAARAGCAMKVTAPAPVVGTWDRLRIERVVINLLTDALKHGAGKPVDVTVEQNESAAVLRLSDRRISSAPEGEHAIEPNASGAAGHRPKGLGVGLYSAQQIVRAHGGTIRIEGHASSVFTAVVELPW